MQIQWPYRKKNRAAGQVPSQSFVRPLRAALFSDELLRRHAIGLAGRPVYCWMDRSNPTA